jgi:hypothetical protein
MPVRAISEVAGVRPLDDDLDQRRPAQLLGEAPGTRLVDPHQRRVQDEAPFHAEVQRHLQRLNRVVAAVRVAGVVRLAHAGDEVAQPAPVGQGGREGEEDEIPARDEGVRQPVPVHPDLGLAGECRVRHLAEGVEPQGMVLAETRRPVGECLH